MSAGTFRKMYGKSKKVILQFKSEVLVSASQFSREWQSPQAKAQRALSPLGHLVMRGACPRDRVILRN